MSKGEQSTGIDDQLAAALFLYRKGWTPIPVGYRSKKAIAKAWQKTERSRMKLTKQFGHDLRNIGFLTGSKHDGPVDVDIDGADVNAVIRRFLPETPCSFGREAGPVSHFLYDCDLGKTRKFVDPVETEGLRGVLVELRANGAYTLAPGSIHENGDRVVWHEQGDPAAIETDALVAVVARSAACALLARHFPSTGMRHDALLALTGFLVQRGWSGEETIAFAEAIADHNHYSESDIGLMVSGASDKVGAQPLAGPMRLKELWPEPVIGCALDWLALDAGNALQMTDSALAYRFVDTHLGVVRYVPERRKWLRYDGKLWRYDGKGAVKNLVRGHLDAINVKGDPGMGSNQRINSVLDVASIDPRIVVEDSAIDKELDLLGTPTGIIDLRTGQFLEADEPPIVTKSTSVEPDFDAEHPLWSSFLDEVTEGNRDVRLFLKRWAGYCATGRADEQALLILLGEGENGKSIIQNVLSDILGDYSRVAPDNMFIASSRDPAPIEMAHLEASRIVIASEPESGRKWNEGLLKKVTGGDKVYGRRHYAEGMDIKATGKLLFSANEMPAPKTVNHAMRRRFLILEMDYIPEDRDGRLPDKLRNEYPAILAWILRGAKSWYKRGLCPPTEILAARDAYFDAYDWPSKWLKHHTRRDLAHFETNARIIASFNAFMRSEGQEEWTSQTLGPILGRKFKPDNKRVGGLKSRGYRGLRIL